MYHARRRERREERRRDCDKREGNRYRDLSIFSAAISSSFTFITIIVIIKESIMNTIQHALIVDRRISIKI